MAKNTRFASVSEQVASHLKKLIHSGEWGGDLPGRSQLATRLGVSGNTMETALRQLQKEGLIQSAGAGRRRKIALSREDFRPSKLRLVIQHYEPSELHQQDISHLQYELREAGHTVQVARKALTELGMDTQRVIRQMEPILADGRIVSGGSRDILTWFAEQEVPAFAFFGSHQGIPIAAVNPDKIPAIVEATSKLIQLGHRRIVMLTRRERRQPLMGTSEQAFLDTLNQAGISPSSFNIPDWEETAKGLHQRLESMFRITSPTAIIVQTTDLLYAVMQFLMSRRLSVPEDVSLICTNPSTDYLWCHRPISHIAWESHEVIHRTLQWARNVARGKEDKRQTLTKARFISGGTIGPATGHR